MDNLEKALILLKNGEIEQGRDVLLRLVQFAPDSTDILFNLGMCYSEAGDYAKSIEMLERCVEIAPTLVNAWVALGFSYSRGNLPDKALAALTNAILMEPENIYALKNLGSVQASLGRWSEARSTFEKVDALYPNVPEVQLSLAQVHEAVGDLDEAKRLYAKTLALSRNPQLVAIANNALEKMNRAESVINQQAVGFLVEALRAFSTLSMDEIRAVVFEIGRLGMSGLSVHDSEPRYEIETLPGHFTGLQLVCYLFAGFKIIDDTVEGVADLEEEYAEALQEYGRGNYEH